MPLEYWMWKESYINYNLKVKSQSIAQIKVGEVHIWSAYLPDFKDYKAYFDSILSKDERERATSFKFIKDNEQFTFARGILRCILARYLGESPQDLKIIYGLWGKPCLPREKLLHFNISHSRDYALYAVAPHYEVGIDLEYIDKNLDLENMSSVLFSQHELKYWKSLIASNQADFFFKAWVGKEAFLKAIGKGWLAEDQQMPLDSSFFQKQDLMDENLNSYATNPYFFNRIPGFASALYVKGPPLKVLFYNFKCG